MDRNLSVFQVFTMLLAEKFRPKYDARLQLLAYQVNMLRSRIDDDRIYTTPRERAELIRLGETIDHNIADVMLVVKPAIDSQIRCGLVFVPTNLRNTLNSRYSAFFRVLLGQFLLAPIHPNSITKDALAQTDIKI